jgi:hypothetical protein
MKTETVYFESKGKLNTEKTIQLAYKRATELGITQIVIATNSGHTPLKAAKLFKTERIIAVTHSTGFREIGMQELSIESRKQLEEIPNITILTTTHAFGGVGRSVRMKLGTYQIDEVIA